MRRPLNWVPIYPDEGRGPTEKIDGYNAYFFEDVKDLFRGLARIFKRMWRRSEDP